MDGYINNTQHIKTTTKDPTKHHIYIYRLTN